YAYQYKCNHAFAYDSYFMLIIRFERSSRDELQRCPTKHWLIPYNATAPQVTARRAFCSLVRDAYQLDVGNRAGDSGRVNVEGLTLCRGRATGRAIWQDQNHGPPWRTLPEHPTVSRSLDVDGKKWIWTDDEGSAVRHEEQYAI
ncbi:hypothetical protein LTR95_018200, partial [Oleoguttula sp. CCFEE 5521]